MVTPINFGIQAKGLLNPFARFDSGGVPPGYEALTWYDGSPVTWYDGTTVYVRVF